MVVELNLKDLRKRQGLTQQQVAERLGISREHYCEIENNRTTSINRNHLAALAKLFDCSPAALFGEPGAVDLGRALAQAEQAISALRTALGA